MGAKVSVNSVVPRLTIVKSAGGGGVFKVIGDGGIASPEGLIIGQGGIIT